MPMLWQKEFKASASAYTFTIANTNIQLDIIADPNAPIVWEKAIQNLGLGVRINADAVPTNNGHHQHRHTQFTIADADIQLDIIANPDVYILWEKHIPNIGVGVGIDADAMAKNN